MSIRSMHSSSHHFDEIAFPFHEADAGSFSSLTETFNELHLSSSEANELELEIIDLLDEFVHQQTSATKEYKAEIQAYIDEHNHRASQIQQHDVGLMHMTEGGGNNTNQQNNSRHKVINQNSSFIDDSVTLSTDNCAPSRPNRRPSMLESGNNGGQQSQHRRVLGRRGGLLQRNPSFDDVWDVNSKTPPRRPQRRNILHSQKKNMGGAATKNNNTQTYTVVMDESEEPNRITPSNGIRPHLHRNPTFDDVWKMKEKREKRTYISGKNPRHNVMYPKRNNNGSGINAFTKESKKDAPTKKPQRRGSLLMCCKEPSSSSKPFPIDTPTAQHNAEKNEECQSQENDTKSTMEHLKKMNDVLDYEFKVLGDDYQLVGASPKLALLPPQAVKRAEIAKSA